MAQLEWKDNTATTQNQEFSSFWIGSTSFLSGSIIGYIIGIFII